ncbi:hypothetical protein Pint_31941 [Pistacia integerrima]|nr:hypothetical protein Pint_31941 [Pistacia integerrima]KAJ0100563.1 hypothetical protein Patl1_21674 [Pistacia atlantica]
MVSDSVWSSRRALMAEELKSFKLEEGWAWRS